MRFAIYCAVAAILLCSAVTHAHEIGTTQVSVMFQEEASYRIEIVTDAAALGEKLQAVSGQTWNEEAFRRNVVLAFDGIAVEPEIDYSVSDVPSDIPGEIDSVATIRLRGTVPQNAHQFVWTYPWTFATYSLKVRGAGAETVTTEWLEGGQSSTPFSLVSPQSPLSRTDIAIRYLTLGFTHIVPHGLDHMLFVLGIFLLSRRLRQVLAQVTAFTIAHSITLALSIYGVVSVSPGIVEPLIAISIAYVAIENIFLSELRPWRLALVFAFGLLHGMGFAGVLKELGLPRSEFVTALISFNAGVEAGQLAVIGAAFVLVGWYCNSRHWYRRVVVIPASAVIACTAVYWTVERL
jgi:hydrogenase/urease accessory protein HupE